MLKRAFWSLSSYGWGLCSLALGCTGGAVGESSVEARQAIVGGVVSEPGDFPAVVSLGGCSGTLVHRRLVLYAAHCGTAISEVRFGVDAAHPERTVATDFCSAYPAANLGDGTDLAYCVLAADVRDVQPARLLAGCERRELAPGREVTLVGFGIEADGGDYGTARSARATLEDIAAELLIAGHGVDTCRGDSGGPVLMSLESGELRVVGVTSSGSSRQCGQGVAHYVDVTRKLSWLEESGLDVTPCFDGELWAPTGDCTSVGPDDAEPGWLSTCGEAWRVPADASAPSLEIARPAPPLRHVRLANDELYFEAPVEAQADDLESGIKSVTFTLRSHQGEVLVERVDEVAPYGLPTLRLPVGSFTLEARAENFVGISTARTVALQVDAPDTPARDGQNGCGLARLSVGNGYGSVAVLLWLAARARRKEKRRPRWLRSRLSTRRS